MGYTVYMDPVASEWKSGGGVYPICKTVDDQTQFIVVDAPEKYHDALRNLAFVQTHEGFQKDIAGSASDRDRAFDHFQQHFETIIQQAAGEIPVPWEQAFEAFLARTQPLDCDWWVTGSLGLTLRGLPITPGDIDLVVDGDGAVQWGRLLADVMVEPVSRIDGWFCQYWGRAFLHARVEWVGGVDPDDSSAYVQELYRPSVAHLETIDWHGYRVRIPPLEPQLKIEESRGRAGHVKIIRDALKASSASYRLSDKGV